MDLQLSVESVPCWVWITIRRDVLDIKLCDQGSQWLVADCWFSPGTPVSSTNKTGYHDTAEILLEVALNTINLNPTHLHVKSGEQTIKMINNENLTVMIN